MIRPSNDRQLKSDDARIGFGCATCFRAAKKLSCDRSRSLAQSARRGEGSGKACPLLSLLVYHRLKSFTLNLQLYNDIGSATLHFTSIRRARIRSEFGRQRPTGNGSLVSASEIVNRAIENRFSHTRNDQLSSTRSYTCMAMRKEKAKTAKTQMRW